MTRRRRPTRRAGSGDAHEARLAILEHRFPETMQARCSWCGQVQIAREGTWMEVFVSSPGTGIASTHVFRCSSCEHTEIKGRGVGTGIVAVPRQRQGRGAAGEGEGDDRAAVAPVEAAAAERDEPEAGAEPAEVVEVAERVEANEIDPTEEPEPEPETAEEAVREMAGAGTPRS